MSEYKHPGLHQEALTDDLVDRFALALKAKLRASEAKYGWQNGWLKDGWRDDCQRDLTLHVAKGDPLDVAAYAAFCWHHGWSTSAPTPDLGAQGEPPGGCNGVTLETSKQMITALARGVSEASSGEGEPEDLRRERREDRDEASPKNEEPANWPEHMRGSELHPANRERVQHIDRLVAASRSGSDDDV